MGIEGLLSFLKPIITKSHISSFENQTVAIDAMSWLYRGSYSCSYELNMNIKTKDYLHFINKCLQMLRRHKIKPIMVFDGRSLFVKKKTEEHRKKIKKANIEKAQGFLEKGDEREARKYFSRAIKITKEMIYNAIDLCRQMKVDFILAPYESDAQIAFLVKNSYAHLAISEDSDLIAYGCQKVILKFSPSGDCQYLNLTPYKEVVNRVPLKDKQLKTFLAFEKESLIYSCILAGCDYLPSIKGIGIKKAVDFLHRSGGKIDGTVRRLQFEKAFMGKIPDDYAKTVKKIALVFKYQRIYDPHKKGFSSLEPLPEDLNDEATNVLIGEKFDEIEGFASGDLDIKKLTKREIDNAIFKDLMETEMNKKMENFKNNAEKMEWEKKRNLGTGTQETVTENIEEFGTNEDFDDGNNENSGETDKENNQRPKNREYLGKMEEQIDYLFDLCKEFSHEFGGNDEKVGENENFEDLIDVDEENEKNNRDDEEIIVEKTQRLVQINDNLQNKNIPNIKGNVNKNQTVIKNSINSQILEKKTETVAKTQSKEPPKNPNKSNEKPQNYLEPPKNPFSFQEKTNKQTQNPPQIQETTKSPIPKASQETKMMKSPENPFLVKNSGDKNEWGLLDSLAKLSEKSSAEKLGKESTTSKIPFALPKKSAEKTNLINKKNENNDKNEIITKTAQKTEEKTFIFNKKASEQTMKKAPEKRRESTFEENQKENASIFSVPLLF